MPETLKFELYQAFSKSENGGSEVAVVHLSNLPHTGKTKQEIAKKLGYPATAFIHKISGDEVTASFYSKKAKLSMCGHGTIGLMTSLIETRRIKLNVAGKTLINLKLPTGTAKVEIKNSHKQPPLISLEVQPPTFRNDQVETKRLLRILGLSPTTILPEYPIETATGDFVHLVVPLNGLSDMKKIKPDFPAIISFCHEYGLQTLALFCTETEHPGKDIHVRDFCPAVGVYESAAAGTTNAAIAGYIFRHNLLNAQSSKVLEITAEQGLEIGKPSQIFSSLLLENTTIKKQLVSGVATWNKSGVINL